MKRVFYSGILAAAAFATSLENARAQSNVYSLNVGSFFINTTNPVTLQSPTIHSLFIGPQSSRFGLQTELDYPSIPWGSTPQPDARYTRFSLDFIHTSQESNGFVYNSTRLATFSRGPFRLSLNPWLATPILLIVSARLWVVFFRDRRQKFQPAMPMAH